MLKVDRATLSGESGEAQKTSFEIGPGEVLVLGGPSGSGKSSLAKQIAGIQARSEGSGAVDTGGDRPCLIMQNYEEVLCPALSIEKGVGRLISMDSRVTPRDALACWRKNIWRLGLNDDVLSKPPRQVSGGQMQRCLIALGLATGASLVIYDETLAGLDMQNKDRACKLIEETAAQSGKSVLIVGHDQYLHRRFRAVFIQS